jgi:hypothetical protein
MSEATVISVQAAAVRVGPADTKKQDTDEEEHIGTISRLLAEMDLATVAVLDNIERQLAEGPLRSLGRAQAAADHYRCTTRAVNLQLQRLFSEGKNTTVLHVEQVIEDKLHGTNYSEQRKLGPTYLSVHNWEKLRVIMGHHSLRNQLIGFNLLGVFIICILLVCFSPLENLTLRYSVITAGTLSACWFLLEIILNLNVDMLLYIAKTDFEAWFLCFQFFGVFLLMGTMLGWGEYTPLMIPGMFIGSLATMSDINDRSFQARFCFLQFASSCVLWAGLALALHLGVLQGLTNTTYNIGSVSWDVDQLLGNRLLTLAIFTAKNSVFLFHRPNVLMNVRAPIRIVEPHGQHTWTLLELAALILKCDWNNRAEKVATALAQFDTDIPPVQKVCETANTILLEDKTKDAHKRQPAEIEMRQL